jgi:GT2 family glycosyltransferase
MQAPLSLSIAIPTYQREAVLVETIEYLLALQPRAAEILVLDQTLAHQPAIGARLQELDGAGLIRWFRLPAPSITGAMNEALRRATQDIVLFVDDDVQPEPDLLVAHLAAHRGHPDALVAGRVIQPWEEEEMAAGAPLDGFASTQPGPVKDFIGCNFSLRRSLAVDVGGFDENFVRVAYRYEAEFAYRYRASGRPIHFEPLACLHHLKATAGGTRAYGEHLSTWRPDHAVGAYYYGLRTLSFGEFLRPFRSIATSYHLRNPWRIPGTMLAELAAIAWALALFVRGPKRIATTSGQVSK